MKIKRFVVFAYDTYYPGGGWSDFISSHDTMEEALGVAKQERKSADIVRVLDLETGEITYDPT